MPPEIPVPRALEPAFGLIETFRWSPDAGYDYLDQHMARLEHSASVLGFACRRDLVEGRLAAFAAGLAGAPARVRLVLSKDGSIEVASTPLNGPPIASYRVAIAGSRHRAEDQWLRHKTTMRDRYEHPLAAAVAAVQADEILFLNDNDEVCEGARSNIFVKRGGMLLTPPLLCGVLPGTLRAHLIEVGEAEEAVLRLSDLADAAFFMGNSVRGLVPSTLVPSSERSASDPMPGSMGAARPSPE